MSSGFVSGGTIDKPVERDDEWVKAQQELEANRRRKEEESQLQGGRSLYEVLQANKAAKQEAFEESTKLKNQFRNLDEDEVEFLDSVLESTRAKEEAVKKETTEQLDLFRKQQEEADKAILEEVDEAEVGTGEAKAGSPTAEGSAWAVNARKRKRVKEKEGLKGIKLRKSSSATEPSENTASFNNVENEIALTAPKKDAGEKAETVSVTSAAGIPIAETVDQLQTSPNEIALSGSTKSSNGTVSEPTATGGLGLGGYSSEEDG